MGMSPSVTSLFCFFDIVNCSQFYQYIDQDMTIVFYDKYPAENHIFSSCFYFAVNIENMIEKSQCLDKQKVM